MKDNEELAYPLTPDRTIVETHYNRSRKIRSRVYAFLLETALANRGFDNRSSLAYQGANVAKCSYQCATSWINQYTAENGDFYIFDDDHRIAYRRQVAGK